MAKKYMVDLSEEELKLLNDLLTSGIQRVRKMTHARILLCANKGWADRKIQEALSVSIPSIERVRQRYVEQGLEAALSPRRSRTPTGWGRRDSPDCPGLSPATPRI